MHGSGAGIARHVCERGVVTQSQAQDQAAMGLLPAHERVPLACGVSQGVPPGHYYKQLSRPHMHQVTYQCNAMHTHAMHCIAYQCNAAAGWCTVCVSTFFQPTTTVCVGQRGRAVTWPACLWYLEAWSAVQCSRPEVDHGDGEHHAPSQLPHFAFLVCPAAAPALHGCIDASRPHRGHALRPTPCRIARQTVRTLHYHVRHPGAAANALAHTSR